MSQISSTLPQIYLDDTRVCDFASSSQDTNCFTLSGCTAGRDTSAGCIPNTTCTACGQKPWSVIFTGTGVDVFGNAMLACGDTASSSSCKGQWSLDGEDTDCSNSGINTMCIKRGLSNTNHTLTLNNGKTTLIDYALVQTQSDTPLHPKDKLFVDANVHSIQYTGEWELLSNLAEFGYNVQRSDTKGDAISFSFLGDEIEAIASYNSASDNGSKITMKVTPSQGGDPQSIDTEVASGLPRYFTSSSNGLSEGLYSAKVTLDSDGTGYSFNGFLYHPLPHATTVREAIDIPSDGTTTTTDSQASPTGGSDDEGSGGSHKSSNAGVIAGGVAGGMMMVLVILGLVWFWRRRKRAQEKERTRPTPWEEPLTKGSESMRPPTLAYTDAEPPLNNRTTGISTRTIDHQQKLQLSWAPSPHSPGATTPASSPGETPSHELRTQTSASHLASPNTENSTSPTQGYNSGSNYNITPSPTTDDRRRTGESRSARVQSESGSGNDGPVMDLIRSLQERVERLDPGPPQYSP